jgi:hypothetical protein
MSAEEITNIMRLISHMDASNVSCFGHKTMRKD